MRETLEEIKVLRSKERGCVPNLQGASPVGREDGGRSYVARSVSSGRPRRRRCDRDGVLNMTVITVVKLSARAGGADAHAGRAGRDSIPWAERCRRAGVEHTGESSTTNWGLAGCDRFEVGHPESSRVRGAEWLNSRGTSWEDGQHSDTERTSHARTVAVNVGRISPGSVTSRVLCSPRKAAGRGGSSLAPYGKGRGRLD